MLVIPIEPGVPNQRLSVKLDGSDYVLRFFWNSRDESWYWELLTSALVPVWCGARVAVGQPLLEQCVSDNRPPGELMAIDTSNQDRDPGLEDFGDDPSRVKLLYATAAELGRSA